MPTMVVRYRLEKMMTSLQSMAHSNSRRNINIDHPNPKDRMYMAANTNNHRNQKDRNNYMTDISKIPD